MDSSKYKQALANLNPRQREAVETIDGPVMVIAGPGTGKTQILSMRIAEILSATDTPADGILALTFTESGAISIRKRLLELIGRSAYDVAVYTFHGFANTIIQTYPDYFPRIIGGRQCEPIEQIEIIQNIIEQNSFELIKPFGRQFYYVNPILNAIQDLKKENYSPEKFADLIKRQEESFENIEDLYHEKGRYKGQMKGAYADLEKKIRRNHELLAVYTEYEKQKFTLGLYDYDDMILELLNALEENNEFLMMLQERFLYILADEHQDANRSQNKLLELLSSFHDNPNIFVVGDDKQAIYRFQGASLENFLYFKTQFPGAKIIELEDNYRSTQHVLDISQNLIANNPTLSEKPLKARSGIATKQATVITTKNPRSEARCIARKIKELISLGEKPEEIAVLYRNNRHGEEIREALVQNDIEYSLHGAAAEMPHIITEQLLDVLRVIADPSDEARLAQILFYGFFDLDPKDIFTTFEKRRSERQSLIQFAENNPKNPTSTIILQVLDLHKESHNTLLTVLFEKVLAETKIIESVLNNPDSARIIGEIQSLFSLAKNIQVPGKNIRLSDFLSYIDRAAEYNLPIFSSANNKKAGVQLMTAHRSKGLEFNSVFIAGLTDSNWGGKSNRENFYLPELKALKVNEKEHIKEDERRLFYVSLTRAKQNLFLSYYLENENGREELQSEFISELDEDSLIEEECSEETELTLTETTIENNSLFDKENIGEMFFRRGLNATAVNKYLRCSWDYFFTGLIQLPQSYSTSALFGTAMHSALQTYFEERNDGYDGVPENPVTTLMSVLKNSDLEENEVQRFFERGKTAIHGYHKEYGSLPKTQSELEKNIYTTIETPSGVIKLSGKLDKVEVDENGKSIVTDFKTGKPRSRNDIEGKTQSSNGDYKRQLVFYSLLLEQKGEQMSEGVIDFIEPNERGKYRRERFEITSEEKEELVEAIHLISEEVLSLVFVEKGCKEKTCEWCRLAGILMSR